MATNNNDETSAAEIVGLLGGVGILLMQAAAMMPGLLPILFLLLPLVVPLIVLGLVGGILVGVPYALWRLAKLVLRSLLRRWPGAEPPRDAEATTSAGDALGPELAASR